jgi:multiple sugar transport system ATP-binding protein
MAEVKLQGIKKTFGDVIALDDISLEIADREFVTLLGPTGAGKTTTLRCVVGLEKPEKGDITVDGEVITKLSPGERDMAFVSQHYALYPQYTVYKNLEFPLNKRPLTRVEKNERITKVAKILHIDHLLERKPEKLSGGEMQRVVIGRAMVRSPKLFLLDEPLSNLDAKLREELRFELKRLQQETGATTLFVTHDQVEAMSMSDRIVVLYKGKIQQTGTPAEIYSWPANTLVSSLVGSPGMNLLDGTITNGSFVGGDGQAVQIPVDYKPVVSRGSYKLGIRPENIKVVASGTPASLPAEVYMIESLGYEKLVSFKLDSERLRARFPSRMNIHVGEKVTINLDEAKIRFFDSEGRLVKTG